MKATIREVLRHLLYKAGAYDLLLRRRQRAGHHVGHLQAGSLESRFAQIYEASVWQRGARDDVPKSGEGSSLAATAELRQALPDVLDQLGSRTLVDIGCGDFTWMQHVAVKQNYIGLDVVASVIAENRDNYLNEHREFLVVDATKEDIPDGDVILCREVLFHLSFADIRHLLKNVLSKPRSYLLLTTDREAMVNADIPTGDFRPLNLQAWPLRLPAPERVVADAGVSPYRVIGVWKAASLRPLFQ